MIITSQSINKHPQTDNSCIANKTLKPIKIEAHCVRAFTQHPFTTCSHSNKE